MRGKALVGGAGLKRLSFAVTAAVMLFSIFIAVPFVFFPEKAEAAITLRSSTTNSSAPCNAGLTINKPSGVIVGDVMVAQIASDGGAISTPSGWATIDNASYHSGNIRLATFFRIIEGAEGSNFTFPVGTSTSCIGGIMAFEGVDNGQVIDSAGTARNSDSNTGTTVSVPTITTSSVNTMLVASMVKSNGATTNNFTAIAGGTESYDFGVTGALAIAGDYGNYVGPGSIAGLTSTITSANWAVHFVALKPATVHMMLLWDGGGSAPAGWSYVTSAEGYMLRGEEAVNYGLTGGQNNHTHTVSSVSYGAPSTPVATLNATGDVAASGHTHTAPSATVSPATNGNVPAYRNLRLIRFNSGIPNIIPQGAIALFDNSPGIPLSGWTRVSDQDNRVTRIANTAGGTGGSDTHAHNVTFSGNLGASSGTVQRSCTILVCNSNEPLAGPTHTHTVPTSSTLNSSSNLPPYVQMLFAKANNNTPTLSVGIIAMFDGSPGGGWVVRSNPGGPYHQRFLRGSATYDEGSGLGAAGHTHNGGSVTSGPASTSLTWDRIQLGAQATRSNHTHDVTPNLHSYITDPLYTGNNEYFLPPYFNVVIAEKVNFILDSYRWYEDTNSEIVSSLNEWSVLNVPTNNPILTIPTAYNPPVPGTELRLRVRVEVNNNQLAAGEIQFKLQYKEGTDGSCTTGTWTDVDEGGGSSIWRYATSGITDGQQLTTSVLGSDILQRYVKSQNAGTNPNPVPVGDMMEYDFHIENNGAPGATKFSFRLVEDSGILLSLYSNCPTLSTKPNIENQLRHGNFFESEAEKGFSWVN